MKYTAEAMAREILGMGPKAYTLTGLNVIFGNNSQIGLVKDWCDTEGISHTSSNKGICEEFKFNTEEDAMLCWLRFS